MIMGNIYLFMHSKENTVLNVIVLGYLQVLPAIPKYLLEKARSQPYSHTRNNLNNTIFQFSSSVTIVNAKMKYRDYYWLFINSSKIELSGIKNGRMI